MCEAITNRGKNCNNPNIVRGEPRCTLHHSIYIINRRQYIIKQFELGQKRTLKQILRDYEETTPNFIEEEYDTFKTTFRARQKQEFRAFIERLNAQDHVPRSVIEIYNNNYQLTRTVEPQREDPELEKIANDAQGVHRKPVVDMVKKTIEVLRKVYVPYEYNYNTISISKTCIEIITECNLSPETTCEFVKRYTLNESIYDFEQGIYGKIIDRIWQYIKNYDKKEELIKILKQELNDNVGTCTQGNLTRICNVLCGYIDGLEGIIDNKNQILGNAFSVLMNLSNESNRLEKAKELLKEHDVNPDEWNVWLEPLMD